MNSDERSGSIKLSNVCFSAKRSDAYAVVHSNSRLPTFEILFFVTIWNILIHKKDIFQWEIRILPSFISPNLNIY